MISLSPILNPSFQYQFLIIGCGNTLLSGAAVGHQVAKEVAAWSLPSVISLAVQQLTPELAIVIAETDYVIFVDACAQSYAQAVKITPLAVCSRRPNAISNNTDGGDPLSLLKITQERYGLHPQAWSIHIPTECLHFENRLSATTHQGCDRALRTIEQFFTTYRQPSGICG